MWTQASVKGRFSIKNIAYELTKFTCGFAPFSAGIHLCDRSLKAQTTAVHNTESVFYLPEIFLGYIIPPPEPY